MSRLSNAGVKSVISNSSKSSHYLEKEIHVDKVTVANITKYSWMEKLNYMLDVLVPPEEERELMLPKDCYLQQVRTGDQSSWRAVKDKNYDLGYLARDLKQNTEYKVYAARTGWFTALDLNGMFLAKWNILVFVMLIFTALITPFEIAFIRRTIIVVDLLFLMNRVVDCMFLVDMFVQMKTPYRCQRTGRLVLDVRSITAGYLKGWFILDLISVIPFEFLQYINNGSSSALGFLQILRFLRLTRLLKLLKFRHLSRKLKQLHVTTGVRYYQLELLKVVRF
jgi:Ion transport protein